MQQRDSVPHRRAFSHVLFYYGLSEDIGYSFLCYSRTLLLIILYIQLHQLVSNSRCTLRSPLATPWQPCVYFLRLWVCLTFNVETCDECLHLNFFLQMPEVVSVNSGGDSSSRGPLEWPSAVQVSVSTPRHKQGPFLTPLWGRSASRSLLFARR